MISRLHTQTLAVVILTGMFTAKPASAQTHATSTGTDQQALSLTVYNSNVALVRDVRSLRLPAGSVELRFEDVPSQIDPATVRIASLTSPGRLTVLEQDYRYDLLSPQKLLHDFVGKQITLVREIMDNNSTREVQIRATLISDNNGLIWQVGDQIMTGIPTDHYIFPDLPPGLYNKPTLVWLLDNRQAGEQKLETDYITKSVNWTADYVLTLPADGMPADLRSWVSVTNNGGVGFRNAQLQLVAGQLHQAMQAPHPLVRMEMGAAKAMVTGISEEGLSEYHLYTIERRVTLPDNSSKQIALISAQGIKVDRTYEINGQPSYYFSPYQGGETAKEPVEAHLKFKNSESNSLGTPLPAGIVRVYQADSEGRIQFVGEDRINHTPKDETVNLNIGNAFDVTAERKQTDFQTLGQNFYESAFQITIRNHKGQPITVEVNEPFSGDWNILNSTFKYDKTSAFSARFTVAVPADGQSILNYRVRVRR
ncbi:MAG TPA: DUF4139 domain-containing protein [Terriglobia bacterium]|nr:DUF4139 domain-containing protein [Terriglobia bacterium]